MNTIAYFGLPGGTEVILILFIIMLLFGAKKLPELSRSLGKSLGEFKKGKDDLEREIRDVQEDLHKVATEPEIEEVKTKEAVVGNTPDEKPEADKPA